MPKTDSYNINLICLSSIKIIFLTLEGMGTYRIFCFAHYPALPGLDLVFSFYIFPSMSNFFIFYFLIFINWEYDVVTRPRDCYFRLQLFNFILTRKVF